MKKLMSIILLLMFQFYCFQPVFALENDDYISIDRDAKHLGSRLHKEYGGYVFTIKNKSEYDINIEAISFEDNLTGEAAYQSVSRSSIAIGLKTLGAGVVFALPTLTLSLFGAVLIAPIQMIGNTCGNIGAKQDSRRYDKRISSCVLKSHSDVQLKTIGVKHHHPTITVIYKIVGQNDLKTLKY